MKEILVNFQIFRSGQRFKFLMHNMDIKMVAKLNPTHN